MPEKEQILSNIRRLPAKPVERMTEADEAWESDEHGAHFIVSKEIFPFPLQMTVFSLSLSGATDARRRIIDDFRLALGPEMVREWDSDIEFVLWDSNFTAKRN